MKSRRQDIKVKNVKNFELQEFQTNMVNPSPTLTVVVRNREKVLYSGQVQAVSSINDKGIFDVLPQHENFISLIKEKVIIHPTLAENKEIQIENGILRVSKDKVYVYVNFKP